MLLLVVAVPLAGIGALSRFGRPNSTQAQYDWCRDHAHLRMTYAEVSQYCGFAELSASRYDPGDLTLAAWDGHRSMRLDFRYGRLVGVREY